MLLYANRKDIRIVRTNDMNQNEAIIVDGLVDSIAVVSSEFVSQEMQEKSRMSFPWV